MNVTLRSFDMVAKVMHPILDWTATPTSHGNGAVLSLLTFIAFVCRLAALALAIPFLLCIGLDIIAYAIARTLHLSMSQTRIPRSPPDPTPRGLAFDRDSAHSRETPCHSTSSDPAPSRDALLLHVDAPDIDTSGPILSPKSIDAATSSVDSSSTSLSDYSSSSSTTASDGPVSHFNKRFPPGPKQRIGKRAAQPDLQ